MFILTLLIQEGKTYKFWEYAAFMTAITVTHCLDYVAS